MKQLNQPLTKFFGLLLLLTIVAGSCKKSQVDPVVTGNSTLSVNIDGKDFSVTDANLAATYYSTAGDNTNSLMTTATLDTSGTSMTFFVPDISAGTITIAPKLGTSFNPGVLSARAGGVSFATTTTVTVQAYIVYKINGNTYYAVSGTITTTYDNTKITVKWNLVFKDADGRTFTSTGSYTIYNYQHDTKPKTSVPDPTPVSAKPTINNIAPTSGSGGDSVIIAGTNFSTTLTDNVVLFNGVPATVKSATATKLVVLAPSTGTTGYVTVKVKTSETATGPKFTYLGQATITGISPASGKAGDAVAITGTNFALAAADNIVKFNGVTAVVTESTGSILRVTAPVGVTTGVVTVTVRGKAAVAGLTVNTTFTVLKASTGTASIVTTQLFGYSFKTYSNDGSLWLVDNDGRINKISATAGTSNKNYTTADITFTNLSSYVCKGLARDTNGVIHAYIIGSGSNTNYSAFVISINPSSGVITKDFETTFLDSAPGGFAITSTGMVLLLSNHYGSDDVVHLKTDGTAEVYIKGGTGLDNTLGGTGAYSISVAGPYVYLLTYTKGTPNTHQAIVRFDANKTRLQVIPSFVEGYLDGPLTAAKFSDIRCIEVNNKNGDIYVGDFGNLRIRKITTANIVSTVAGNGATGTTYTGDVLSVNLPGTYGLLFDSNHNTLYNFPAGNVIQKFVFN
jgi:hypothetical protein